MKPREKIIYTQMSRKGFRLSEFKKIRISNKNNDTVELTGSSLRYVLGDILSLAKKTLRETTPNITMNNYFDDLPTQTMIYFEISRLQNSCVPYFK